MMKDPPGSTDRIAAYIRHQAETAGFELGLGESVKALGTLRRFCKWKDPHGLQGPHGRINYNTAPGGDIWGAITHWIELDQDWTYDPE